MDLTSSTCLLILFCLNIYILKFMLFYYQWIFYYFSFYYSNSIIDLLKLYLQISCITYEFHFRAIKMASQLLFFYWKGVLGLWKLLSQRNRGMFLGPWRILTSRLYKFWGVYTVTKFNIGIYLHIPVHWWSSLFCYKGFEHPDSYYSHSEYSRS